jgi:hypothetical protein
MSYADFAAQHLTPHGVQILPYLGAYYQESYTSLGLDLSSCKNIVCFVDGASRDIETGQLWLKGFGCPNVPVYVIITVIIVVTITYFSFILFYLYGNYYFVQLSSECDQLPRYATRVVRSL